MTLRVRKVYFLVANEKDRGFSVMLLLQVLS